MRKALFIILLTAFIFSCKKSDDTNWQNACCRLVAEPQYLMYNDTLRAIPNAFSPNGDGFFDTWYIYGLSNYTNFNLKVYYKNKLVHKQSGSHIPWDGGKYFGNEEFYDFVLNGWGSAHCNYILDLGDGSDLIKGSVCILKHTPPNGNYGCTDGCFPDPDTLTGLVYPVDPIHNSCED